MNQDFLNKLLGKVQTIAILTFMVVAIVFSASIFIPARYSSEIKMIIIQKHQSDKVDAFSASKSAEYLSDIMSKVVFTESFIQDVLDAPFEMKKSFSKSSEKKMKDWEKTVKVRKENNTGILTIVSLDQSQKEAEKIAESIAWALNTRGSKYHGGGDSVEIKIIDGPITSEQPATPNVLANTVLALIVGLAGAIVSVHFFDDFELVLFSKGVSRKNKNNQNQSVKKIVASLEKIRKNLKPVSLVEEEYIIEKPEKFIEKENLTEKEASNNEGSVYSEELIEEIQPEKMQSNSRKGEAPQNLPIFQEEEADIASSEKKSGKGFISMEELNREAERMGLGDNNKKIDSKYEASSAEVKERLNKLLRGEL